MDEYKIETIKKLLIFEIVKLEGMPYLRQSDKVYLEYVRNLVWELEKDPDKFAKMLQKEDKSKSRLPKCLQDPMLYQVKGRMYYMNDSCCLWLLIFVAIGGLIIFILMSLDN